MKAYARRFRALLHRRGWSMVAFVLLLMFFDVTRAWSFHDMPDEVFHESMVIATRTNFWLSLGAVFAPPLVEASGIGPRWRVVTSVLATSLLVSAIALGMLWFTDGPLTRGVREGTLLSNEAYLLRSCWLYTACGLLFAAYSQTRDREVETIRAAQAAELARADSQRDIVASRLQVLQARVEPALLFDALDDVKRAYAHAPAVADALLDDLIAYLRAALPQMRGGPSTLEREARLAEAYLRVTPAGRDGQLVTGTRIADDLGGMPFPPMVLLPLVHAASEVRPRVITITAPHPRGAAVAVHASVEIRVTTVATIGGWDASTLTPIRSVLQQFFGSAALLQIEHDADGASAILTWPDIAASAATELPTQAVPV